MNPSIWGPGTWELIHSASLNFPSSPSQETKNNYKLFYNNLKNILPCDKCKKHYSTIIKLFPIDPYLISKHHLFYWTWKIHNMVNENTNNILLSYDSIIRKYTRLYNMNITKIIDDNSIVDNNFTNYYPQYKNYGYKYKRRYG